MKTCFNCGKELANRNNVHVYKCAKKSGLIADKEIRFRQVCHESDFQFTKNYMEEKYCVEKWSLPDFLKNHNIIFTQTIFLLDYFGIEKRNISEANSLSNKTSKYKKTCLEKYGCNNVSQVEEIKKLKNETCLKNHGIENIWKSKQYHKELTEKMIEMYGKGSIPNKNGNANYWGWVKASVDDKENRCEKLISAYKKWWINLTDDQKTARMNMLHDSAKGNKSKLEKRIAYLLSELEIDYSHQFWIDRRSFDFSIQKTDILLEVNGDFWHANPKLYKAHDLISFPQQSVAAEVLWEKDIKKKHLAEKHGYKVLYIWEDDIKNKDDSEVKKILIELLAGKT